MARIAARKHDHNQALSLLREAVDHGLMPAKDLSVEKDPDFNSLHSDPRFNPLIAHANERAAVVTKK